MPSAPKPKKHFAAKDFRLGAVAYAAGDELSEADATHVTELRPDLVTNDGPKAKKGS